jgi:signal transduction histidine kinase
VLRSLRVRVLLMLLLVVTVAVGVVALFAGRTTTGEFRRYVEASGMMRTRRIEVMLGIFYLQQGNWAGVQPVIEQAAQVIGARIILTNPDALVVADSETKLIGHAVDRGAMGSAVPIAPQGVLAGVAYVMPQPSRLPATGEAVFLGAVNRALWLAAVAAGGVAILLTVLLSRRILTPVEALTAAARRMERGELSQRVDVRSRDEIGELAHAFNSMADGLARLEQLRRNMVSDVAHELRSPLAAVQGYLEGVRDGVIEPTPTVFDAIHRETMRLSRLVSDLQELAAAEAGTLTLMRRPVAVPQIIEQAVKAFNLQMSAKGVLHHTDVAPDLPMVDADADRVEQILRNLMMNALTYTPSGGTVTVGARAVGTAVEISVEDTGVGIAAEDLPFVFERFYRADKSRTRSTGGSGLGLTIVKQLVEAHGGRVGATSVLGGGTRVAFTLPVSRTETHPQAAEGESARRMDGLVGF